MPIFPIWIYNCYTAIIKKIVLSHRVFIAHEVTIYIGIFLDSTVYFCLFVYPQTNIPRC